MTIPSKNISSPLYKDKSTNYVSKGINNPNQSHKYEYSSIMKDKWAKKIDIQAIYDKEGVISRFNTMF